MAMILIVLVYMISLAVFASATKQTTSSQNGRVPMPVIPLGKGEQCVKDTDFMRRNHMSLLIHERDETVHEGVRGEPYSLKECIRCHAVADQDGTAVTVSSQQHFCRSCHDYAAVKIDCFQCHASRPETGI